MRTLQKSEELAWQRWTYWKSISYLGFNLNWMLLPECSALIAPFWRMKWALNPPMRVPGCTVSYQKKKQTSANRSNWLRVTARQQRSVLSLFRKLKTFCPNSWGPGELHFSLLSSLIVLAIPGFDSLVYRLDCTHCSLLNVDSENFCSFAWPLSSIC